MMSARRRPTALTLVLAALAAVPAHALAQGGGSGEMGQAQQLVNQFRFDEAYAMYMRLAGEAETPRARANVHRRLSMAYGAAGDCPNAVRAMMPVIDYWQGQRDEEPQNAFYQEGEMADEVARVCLDSDDIHTSEALYRLGHVLGNLEPEPRTHPASLWDFRLAHALGRIAARRGDADEAHRQVAAARAALDSDPEMAGGQERFFPYLAGYVEVYLGNYDEAETWLNQALEGRGGQDPFFNLLLAMTYEGQGRAADADAQYRKSLEMATGGNPPNVATRRIARQKLGIG